jgi:hypothetical protein
MNLESRDAIKHAKQWLAEMYADETRRSLSQFDEGMASKAAVKYQRPARTTGVPRDNH